MPALKNSKHEGFCHLIPQGAKNGWTQGECYQRAGYRASGHAAEVAASRLMKKVDIQQRLTELAAPAIKRTRATIDALVEQFDQVFDGAMGSAQFGAAGSAAAAKAKLLGFMREKIEIGGVGQFDQCQSPEEVIEALLTHHESPAAALAQLDELRGMIEAYASSHAAVISPEPARPRPDEAALSLAYLRPKHRRR
jgi:hypothetical protein